MHAFTQKWAIIALLDEIQEGTVFHFSEFPLHITLAGVFDIDQSGDQLAKQLADILHGQESFIVKATTKDMFGPNKNVPVIRIEETEELMALYQRIYSWLSEAGASYLEPQYQGSGYLPHSTIQKSGKLYKGDRRSIQSVSLIDLYPNNDGHQRKIFKTIDLQ